MPLLHAVLQYSYIQFYAHLPYFDQGYALTAALGQNLTEFAFQILNAQGTYIIHVMWCKYTSTTSTTMGDISALHVIILRRVVVAVVSIS